MNKKLERASGAWWLPRSTANRSDASLSRRTLLTGAVSIVAGSLVSSQPAGAQSAGPTPLHLAPPLVEHGGTTAFGYAADSATAPLRPFYFQRRALRPDDVQLEILY